MLFSNTAVKYAFGTISTSSQRQAALQQSKPFERRRFQLFTPFSNIIQTAAVFADRTDRH
jgi:hypothetical protein